MISGDESAKKCTQLSLIEKGYINKEKKTIEIDMISLFLLNTDVSVSLLKCKVYQI